MTGKGLVRKTLHDQRISTAALSLTAALLAVLMLLLYPSIAEEYAEIDLPEFYDVFFGEASLATPEGFLAAEYFSWIPIIIIVIAVIAGTGAIAGEEGNGTLEFLMAEPVTRRAVIVRKAIGLALATGAMSLAAFPGLVLGAILVDFELGYDRMLQASLLMLLQVWFFLGLSVLAGAALPSRSAAAMAVTGLAVVAYFANVVGTLIAEAAWLADVNPFGWADYPATLLHGPQWIGSSLLAGFTLLFLALAVWSFERRDIGAAHWPRLPFPGRGPHPQEPQETAEASHGAAAHRDSGAGG